MEKRVVLVDGNAIVHAAWHGYPERLGNDGLSYRALHGFLSKMHRLDRDYQWDELLVIFDPIEGSIYRKALFSGYKAHRPETDPDLRRQLLLVEQALSQLGFSTLKAAGVESDDVIGTLAKLHAGKGSLVMILTPDKDMAQLVDERVGLLRPLRGEAGIETAYNYMNEAGVFSTFGVNPVQIADWLALIGDTSDNIPGVRGVGPKKAAKLLETYGDARTTLTNAEKISGAVGLALLESRSVMETVIKLTTIQVDLDHTEWSVHHASWSEDALNRWGLLAGFPSWMGHFNFLGTDVASRSEVTSLPEADVTNAEPLTVLPQDHPFEGE